MNDQLEDGGYDALLYYLQSIDLTGFQVRNVPQTDALQEQKLLSLDFNEEWWFRKLQEGVILPHDEEWERFAAVDDVTKDFITYMELWRFNRRGNETSLGRFLHRVCPHLSKPRKLKKIEVLDDYGHPKRTTKRTSFYDFGTLAQCRDAWEKLHGKVEWQDPVQMDLDEGPIDTEPPF